MRDMVFRPISLLLIEGPEASVSYFTAGDIAVGITAVAAIAATNIWE